MSGSLLWGFDLPLYRLRACSISWNLTTWMTFRSNFSSSAFMSFDFPFTKPDHPMMRNQSIGQHWWYHKRGQRLLEWRLVLQIQGLWFLQVLLLLEFGWLAEVESSSCLSWSCCLGGLPFVIIIGFMWTQWLKFKKMLVELFYSLAWPVIFFQQFTCSLYSKVIRS